MVRIVTVEVTYTKEADVEIDDAEMALLIDRKDTDEQKELLKKILLQAKSNGLEENRPDWVSTSILDENGESLFEVD